MNSLDEAKNQYGRRGKRRVTAAEEEEMMIKRRNEQRLKSKNEAIRLEFEKHQREQVIHFSDSLKINEAKVDYILVSS
jgi:hypothetical protein